MSKLIFVLSIIGLTIFWDNDIFNYGYIQLILGQVCAGLIGVIIGKELF